MVPATCLLFIFTITWAQKEPPKGYHNLQISWKTKTWSDPLTSHHTKRSHFITFSTTRFILIIRTLNWWPNNCLSIYPRTKSTLTLYIIHDLEQSKEKVAPGSSCLCKRIQFSNAVHLQQQPILRSNHFLIIIQGRNKRNLKITQQNLLH